MREALLAACLALVCGVLLTPRLSAMGQAEPVSAVTAPTSLGVVLPAADAVIEERRPQLQGTGEHPGSVNVTRDGEELCTNSPVRPDGSWRCRPRRDLPHGRITLRVVQHDQQDDVTGQVRHTFFVRPPSPTMTSPTDGQAVRIRRPQFSGRVDLDAAQRRGTVRVLQGARTLCTGQVTGRYRWSCRSRPRLAPGRHLVRAVAVVGSISSRRSGPVGFTVRRPAPPPSPEPATSTPPPRPEEPPQAPSEPGSVGGRDSAGGQQGRSGSGNGGRDPKEPPRPAAGRALGSHPIRLSLTPPAPDLVAGTMSALTAVLGPHRGNAPVRLRVTGRLESGLIYRAVTGPGDRHCRVVRRAFACSLALPPGREAALRIWVTADAARAPAPTQQRLRVVASDPSLNTTVAWRRSVGSARSDRTSPEPLSLAEETATSPGPLLPLLALLLLALAAESARRQPASRT